MDTNMQETRGDGEVETITTGHGLHHPPKGLGESGRVRGPAGDHSHVRKEPRIRIGTTVKQAKLAIRDMICQALPAEKAPQEIMLKDGASVKYQRQDLSDDLMLVKVTMHRNYSRNFIVQIREVI